jgi:hypothetical protein
MDVLHRLLDKTITKEELLRELEKSPGLLPEILNGVSHPKATVRYGCTKVLMDFSAKYPERLYSKFDALVKLLDNKHRIVTWNALAILANLSTVDSEHKFDEIFDKYYDYLNDAYMVTVSNVVGNSARIAIAKPYLAQKIADRLLDIENIRETPHLTSECKKVITQQAIKSFDQFFDEIEDKEKVFSFVKKNTKSSRVTLKGEALAFLEKRKHQ